VSRTQAFFARVNERAALALLRIYKRVLSPSMHAGVPGACCFQPTCSEYAAIALAEHGVLRGGLMATWRVLRCHPFSRGGFDPVPAKNASTTGNANAWTGSSMTGSKVPGIR